MPRLVNVVLLFLALTFATAQAGTGAYVYQTSAQSIANATGANNTPAISFANSTVVRDDDSLFNIATPTRLTAPIAGWYDVAGAVSYAANSSGVRIWWFSVNGHNLDAITGPSSNALNQGGTYTGAASPFYLNQGDYIEIYAFQNSGGSLNTIPGVGNTFISMVRVSD